MADKIQRKALTVAPLRWLYGTGLVLLRNLPRIAFFTLAFYAIFWVGQQLYYKYAPAENFLNYYYAKVDDTPVGTEPLLTLCREVNYEGIKIEAARTFLYLADGSANPEPVAEYTFEANVEKTDTNCQNLRLREQPQKAGTYLAHTEIVFYVNGYRKTDSYDTNRYEMTETDASLEQQIEALEEQIKILRSQIQAAKSGSSSAQQPQSSNQPSQSAQPNQTAQNNAGSQNEAPATPSQPTTPSTPTPAEPEPQAPARSCTIDVLGIKLLCRN